MEPLLFCGFLQKQRFYTLFSFLSKCSTLYLVIIFCIIEYKNRCVRIKVPHICPDPGRHGIWLSPAAAETVSVLCPQLLRCVLLTLFQNIRGTVSLDGILLSFFSLSESRTASTSARNTQTVTVVNDLSFHKLPPVLFFPYLLFT